MCTLPDPRDYVRFRCEMPGCHFFLLAHPDVSKPTCMFCEERLDRSYYRPDPSLMRSWRSLELKSGKLRVFNRYARSVTDARYNSTY
jgi:hypothetical protein